MPEEKGNKKTRAECTEVRENIRKAVKAKKKVKDGG